MFFFLPLDVFLLQLLIAPSHTHTPSPHLLPRPIECCRASNHPMFWCCPRAIGLNGAMAGERWRLRIATLPKQTHERAGESSQGHAPMFRSGFPECSLGRKKKETFPTLEAINVVTYAFYRLFQTFQVLKNRIQKQVEKKTTGKTLTHVSLFQAPYSEVPKTMYLQ